jgi:hypothetical protein
MSSPDRISIKLEIEVPTGGGAPIVKQSWRKSDGVQRDKDREADFTCPSVNALHPVRPSTTAGVGTICATATFTDPPTQVFAQVVTTPDVLGQAPQLVTVVPGRQISSTTWSWSDLNPTANPLPGARYSEFGRENFLVVWSRDAECDPWSRTIVLFRGTAGTNDPCGTPSGNPCGSGSGPISGSGSISGSVGGPVHIAQTFPAFWVVPIAGFTSGPFVAFNAAWALRNDRKAPHPTWHNDADGQSAPSVKLVLCPKNGWELTLVHLGNQAKYIVPFDGNIFGPVSFSSHVAKVGKHGDVKCPSIHASTN